MRTIIIIATILATFALFTQAAPGCNIQITAAPRSYNWPEEGAKRGVVWDISLANTGTCQISTIRLRITPQVAGDALTQTWNLIKQDDTHYTVDLFGNPMPQGQVLTNHAGFVLTYTPAAGGNNVEVVLDSVTCVASGDCAATSTGTTTGSGTTGSGTTGSGTTGSGTTGTTGSTTGGTGTCTVTATLSARPAANGGNWTDEAGRPNQIYDVSLKNTGTCVVHAVRIAFTLQPTSSSFISQRWNLDENFNVNTFGPIPVNGGFGGAGIVLTGPGPISVSVAAQTCNNCS
jgi:hypothetical protein